MRVKQQLVTNRLVESGLGIQDFRHLKLRALSAPETAALGPSFQSLPSVQIPYLTPDGEPMSTHPRHPPFFRVRYLPSKGDIVLQTEKPRRYAQPAGTGVCAYFPATFRDWPELLRDSTKPLLITEGEFKAAKASKEGFPTIGLGGVYSFRSARDGVAFLPELAQIEWPRRAVYVVYDSDYRTNPQVCAALLELSRELVERGALPFVVSLPELGTTKKTGLDDFLVAEKPGALKDLLEQAEPLALAEPLWALNEKVVFVRDPGLVVDLASNQKIAPATFRDYTHGTASYAERIFRKDGGVTLRKTAAAKVWLTWPLRREAIRLTYRPGADRFVTEGDESVLNTWRGWGTEPKKGSVIYFRKLVDHLFRDVEPRAKTWFLRWCAYPLRYPGTKLFTSVCIFGTKQGTGKSLLGLTLGRIYGKNFTEISSGDLHGNFNEWAQEKQLVLGDDVTGSDRRKDADLLKKMITQIELRVNAKYVPSYVVPDRINYFFTSNHPDAFFLEDTDRRFFVHEITVAPLSDAFYATYDNWLRRENGAAAVFHYLRHLDLGNFNPNAPALRTLAKERMTADVKSDVGAFVEKLRLEPDVTLRVGHVAADRDLFTNKQLLHLYDPESRTKVTANGLGRELRRAGFLPVLGGRVLRVGDSVDRYYAVRNPDRWLAANSAAILRHLEKGPE